jgi:hypothetical protein
MSQGWRAHAIFLLAIFMFVVQLPTADAGPKEDALAVLHKWAKAFADSDVDAIVALYAPDALFMGTGSKTVVKDTASRFVQCQCPLSRVKRTNTLRSLGNLRLLSF